MNSIGHLHAPRQTGKTTFLQSWAKELNATRKYVAVCITLEIGQGATLEMGMPAICDVIKEYAEKQHFPIPESKTDNLLQILNSTLQDWAAKTAPKLLVVLFDEVDVLDGELMISFLRQLRSGFADRGVGKFPVSVALVGMRDLKDYLVSAKDGKAVNPGLPFNIREDSVSIGNFTQENIAQLFSQRTAETGQQIETEALGYVWEQSKGQPWIVNNLFKRATLQVLDADNYETITLVHVQKARELIIQAREAHLDSIAFRLELPRVRNVVEKLLTGEVDINLAQSEDFRFCLDLGLVASVARSQRCASGAM